MAARSSEAEPTVDADRFSAAEAVAEAVLYEGYLLYPYRRSSGKNRVRWQFGVLAPPAWIEHWQIPDPGVAGAAESWFQQAECLAEVGPGARTQVRLRFLQLQRKQVYAREHGTLRAVDTLEVAGRTHLSFDEGAPRRVDAEFAVADLLAGEQRVAVELPAATADERVLDDAGRENGRIRRATWPLSAVLRVSAQPADTPFPAVRLRIRVENAMPLGDPAMPRDDVLRHSLIATHTLIGLTDGRFLSLLEPPVWAAPVAADCANRHLFPVLAGADEGSDVVLCSPIILYDHPKVAPESPGDLHDAAEIDEILSLRTLTLTDAEKHEARATDPRAAAIVDRVDAMPPELLAKLHGALRDLPPRGPRPDVSIDLPADVPGPEADPEELPWWDPRAEAAVQPESDTVLVDGRAIGRGALVRLHPRGRGSDAHDMFLTGRTARVHAVLHDVDGSVRVAVTVQDDPAADLQEWYRRYFHFTPEELEPVGAWT